MAVLANFLSMRQRRCSFLIDDLLGSAGSGSIAVPEGQYEGVAASEQCQFLHCNASLCGTCVYAVPAD
jgi:hypothetical protein